MSEDIKYKRNHQITSNPIFLIDEAGEKVGETPLAEALKQAEDAGLDLVEVAPNATPPVAKIMSWSKFNYEQSKKERESKKKSKQKKQKGMRFPATIDIGDKRHKIKRTKEFLDKGHKVRVVSYIKGRLPLTKAHKIIKEIQAELNDYKTLEENPIKEGRQYTLTFLPKATV